MWCNSKLLLEGTRRSFGHSLQPRAVLYTSARLIMSLDFSKLNRRPTLFAPPYGVGPQGLLLGCHLRVQPKSALRASKTFDWGLLHIIVICGRLLVSPE